MYLQGHWWFLNTLPLSPAGHDLDVYAGAAGGEGAADDGGDAGAGVFVMSEQVVVVYTLILFLFLLL